MIKYYLSFHCYISNSPCLCITSSDMRYTDRPEPRGGRPRNLVDSSGRPMKVVSAKWLSVPDPGYVNRSYDRASDYYRSRTPSPR